MESDMTVSAVAPQFKDVLKAWRRRRGVTQQQLADLSTISVRAIRDLEIGRVARPRRDTLRLICDALGLTGRARADFHAAAVAAGDGPVWLDEAAAPAPAVFDDIVGRAAEVAALRDALTGGQRLVALAGLPGAGKTRLALEAVTDLPGLPVLWSAYRGEPTMIRAALSTEGPETARIGASDQLSALIRDRDAVLVCDGYDPDRIDVPAVTALLRACRGLRIVATSRTPLAADGVWSMPVAGLPVPDAVRLLLRHTRLTSGTPAMEEICRRLDGLPGALAAVASSFLFYEPASLLARIEEDPFGVLADAADRPDLEPAVRAAVDVLPRAERALLAAGTVTMRDAAPGTIRDLCARGLLVRGPEARFAAPHLVQTAALLPDQPPIAASARA
jgi:transcriptional regulator with XRE-family HTH domain